MIILGMASANEWRCHIVTGFLIGWVHNQDDHSGYGLSQWETTLLCNAVSHWLSPYANRALLLFTYCVRMKVSLKTKSCHNANFVVTSRHWRSSQIAKFMGPIWGPPGSCRPRWAPCWPHEPCYQGAFRQPAVPKVTTKIGIMTILGFQQ